MIAVSIRPAPADHLALPDGLPGPLPLHRPQPALHLFPETSTDSLILMPMDWTVCSGANMWFHTKTQFLFFHKFTTRKNPIHTLFLYSNLHHRAQSGTQRHGIPFGSIKDWPGHLWSKGPPLAAPQTRRFLHRVPGTTAQPLAACWSSSPAPSPLLPVPTLMCSPAKKYTEIYLKQQYQRTGNWWSTTILINQLINWLIYAKKSCYFCLLPIIVINKKNTKNCRIGY